MKITRTLTTYTVNCVTRENGELKEIPLLFVEPSEDSAIKAAKKLGFALCEVVQTETKLYTVDAIDFIEMSEH